MPARKKVEPKPAEPKVDVPQVENPVTVVSTVDQLVEEAKQVDQKKKGD